MTSLGSALEAFIPRARRLRRAGLGSRAMAAPLAEFYDGPHSSPRFPDTASAVITRQARAFVQDLTGALDDDSIRRPLSYYSIGRIIRSSRRGAVVRRMQY